MSAEVAALLPEDVTRLDLIADEPAPLKVVQRRAIIEAIRDATEETLYFHAGTLRPHLPAGLDPHRIGAVISTLLKDDLIIDTGRAARSGNTKHRNGNRLVPIYYVPNREALA
jgi:hypothetical protein